jgi:hypothetical protein
MFAYHGFFQRSLWNHNLACGPLPPPCSSASSVHPSFSSSSPSFSPTTLLSIVCASLSPATLPSTLCVCKHASIQASCASPSSMCPSFFSSYPSFSPTTLKYVMLASFSPYTLPSTLCVCIHAAIRANSKIMGMRFWFFFFFLMLFLFCFFVFCFIIYYIF